MIPQITNKDTFEQIRDNIFSVLSAEFTNQGYSGKVFTERYDPFDTIISDAAVNIWFAESNLISKASTYNFSQQYHVTYNIDCYGFAVSSGNQAGDEQAVKNSQECVRLVRNILMHPDHLSLHSDSCDRCITSIGRVIFDEVPRQGSKMALNRVVLELKCREHVLDTTPLNLLEQTDLAIEVE